MDNEPLRQDVIMRFSDALTMAIGLLVREKQLSYRFISGSS